jgi:hypothetical protein
VDSTFASHILDKLKAKYGFRKTGKRWLQEGKCPDCNERELFAAAEEPKIVRCGRQNNCGFEISVRDALPDLFENWSDRFERTDTDPNAAADAYLRFERGLDLTGLRGAFTQESYSDRKRGISSATVRFSLPGGSHWERIIDQPGRFEKKAHFKFGGTWAGHCWAHPEDDFKTLAAMDEIWIAEGIFDALALRQNFARLAKAGNTIKRTAVSAMSCNTWPEHFLAALREAVQTCNPKHRVKLVFAFDVGAAGVKWTKKFVPQAKRDGWDAEAALVRPDGDGSKLDWNDLWLRQQAWKGEERKGPLDEDTLADYVWNGDITLADSAVRKARLMYERRSYASFHFRFDNRIYWCRAKATDEDSSTGLNVDEVSNCAFRILYRERDEAADETNYFLEIAFPNATPTAKARFSAACCAASGEFKKRLFAFSGMWQGSQEQLDRLMRDQTREMKTVEPIHFTGYSEPQNAWVLGDIAVRDGRLIKLNAERYFDLGKSAMKLRSDERVLSITYDPDDLGIDWVEDLWTAWGERGILTLAYFTMSLFAVQIRARMDSVGFLEICGEAGSGKTTLVTFMWKLLGRSAYEGFDPNKATAAATARNFIKVSNLPVGLIESGRDENKQHTPRFDPAELLTLFNGRSPRVLGVKSSGTETFEPPFLGTIYLMQNEPIDAMTAVLERIMSFRIDKTARTPETREAARRISAAQVKDVSGWIVHVTRQAESWLKFFFARAEHHDAQMRKRVPDLHNDRIILNHSQLAAAIDTLAHLIPETLLPKGRLGQTVDFVDRIALARQQSSGGDHPTVSRFWEIVDTLIAAEKPEQWADGLSLNQSRKPEELIAINLVEFEKRARMNNIQPPNDADLKRHLRGSRSRKFIDAKLINPPGDSGRRSYCWVFERPASEKPVI